MRSCIAVVALLVGVLSGAEAKNTLKASHILEQKASSEGTLLSLLSYPLLSYPLFSYPLFSYPLFSYPLFSYLLFSSLTFFSLQVLPSYEKWDGTLQAGEDPLAGVAEFLNLPEFDATMEEQVSFLQTGAEATKVHGFCEICILIMQMKERGQPHLCAGLNSDYFISVS